MPRWPKQDGEAEAPLRPVRIRLLRPHGFIDGHGQNRYWHQGEIVGDPAQVELLTERGAHYEPME